MLEAIEMYFTICTSDNKQAFGSWRLNFQKRRKYMNKYNCENCIHDGKGGVFNRSKKCKGCLVEIKDGIVVGKPSKFEEREKVKGE